MYLILSLLFNCQILFCYQLYKETKDRNDEKEQKRIEEKKIALLGINMTMIIVHEKKTKKIRIIEKEFKRNKITMKIKKKVEEGKEEERERGKKKNKGKKLKIWKRWEGSRNNSSIYYTKKNFYC